MVECGGLVPCLSKSVAIGNKQQSRQRREKPPRLFTKQKFILGELAEWLNAAVLKTVEPKGSEGSNPSLSTSPRSSMDRAFGCGPKGCRFDSCRGRHLFNFWRGA